MVSLKRYFEAFDMRVVELDGHSPESLGELMTPPSGGRLVYLLNTVKGKGVSFMENKLEWHYLPLSEELFTKAVEEHET